MRVLEPGEALRRSRGLPVARLLDSTTKLCGYNIARCAQAVRTGEAGTRFQKVRAKVAELVDALALGASGATRESSSLSFRTKLVKFPDAVRDAERRTINSPRNTQTST